MGLNVAFTGGGTGGHIYPGLAVAAALREARTDLSFSWIGNEEGMDRGIVEAAGIGFTGIPAGKFRRDFNLKNLRDSVRVLSGFAAARKALKSIGPRILFSKGGYVSVPPCAAAFSLGIPVFTHESDVNPGLATRLDLRFAERLFVSYGETLANLSVKNRAKAEVTGNPVRASLFSGDAARGRAFLGFTEEAPLILFLGGSQGAAELNGLARSALPALAGAWLVAHQTGRGNAGAAADGPSYRAFPYVGDEIADILAAADVVVGRSGAGTLWECASLGKPLILLPLRSSATRGDQVLNASLFESRGAAIVLPPGDASLPALLSSLESLADPAKRKSMGEAAAAVTAPRAAPLIASRILERIGALP
jgi:UDP-N-acetylglucosamine--N-acetylmuramyl-(pentapeptide) pyrophosphoryl-undecaprenol N-acetylglucosamine transferase